MGRGTIFYDNLGTRSYTEPQLRGASGVQTRQRVHLIGEGAPLQYSKMGEAQKESQGFSIVILGAMNPRIHHPLWYRHHGLITEQEMLESLSPNSQLICLPQIAQFKAAGMQFSCATERWDVRVAEENLRDRMADITATIFDKLLPETPVQVFGFNNEFHLDPGCGEVKRAIMERVVKRGFELSFPGLDGSMFAFTMSAADDATTTVRVEPSDHGPNEIFIAVNANRPVKATTSHFALKPLFDQHYDKDFEAAKGYAQSILNALSNTERGHRWQ